MKSMIVCIGFFLLALNAYSQESKPDLQLTSEQYLEKSKNQQSTAWLLLGVGTAAGIGGTVITFSEGILSDAASGGAALFMLGLTLDIISIPVFIAANKNKKRAMEAVTTIKFEDVPSWSGGAVRQSSVPTLSLQVRF